MAIAEWPTSLGPADYAHFVGQTLVGVVGAERKRRNVMSAVDVQATRYSHDIRPDESFDFAGPWDRHKAPFIFATNGRSYYSALATQSGIWFRDTRDATNASRALEGWFSPKGLTERLEVDRSALGEHTESAFETTSMVGAKSFWTCRAFVPPLVLV